MRRRTAAAVVVFLAVVGAVVVLGVGVAPTAGGLEPVWMSDTPRDNVRNHHAVGVGPGAEVVIAPVTEIPGEDVELTDHSCALVRLSAPNGSVRWRTATPPSACFSHALTQPAIADIEGDAGLEGVVASTEAALVAYEARSGREAWRVPLSSYGYGRPTIVDDPTVAGPGIVASDV
jgi:outer membrane protein assembly factor BamB